MCFNLGFSLALYTGQMCTAPQNIFVPAAGIETDEGDKSVEDVAAGISAALMKLVGDDARAVELLGGVVNDGVLQRLEAATRGGPGGPVLVASRHVTHPTFPDAVVRTPAVVGLDVDDEDTYSRECFGPISYLIRTRSTEESIAVFRRTAAEHGAMTASVYSTQADVIEAMRRAALPWLRRQPGFERDVH
jgi:acyl-CoA reductase-like NAD-dependent aldehyde dehydrogenase